MTDSKQMANKEQYEKGRFCDYGLWFGNAAFGAPYMGGAAASGPLSGIGILWSAASLFVMAGFLLAGTSICVAYAPAVIGAGGIKEPKAFVADALAG